MLQLAHNNLLWAQQGHNLSLDVCVCVCKNDFKINSRYPLNFPFGTLYMDNFTVKLPTVCTILIIEDS